MTPAWLAAALSTLGPTAFAVLTWGSIVLVALVFGYLVRVLIAERGGG